MMTWRVILFSACIVLMSCFVPSKKDNVPWGGTTSDASHVTDNPEKSLVESKTAFFMRRNYKRDRTDPFFRKDVKLFAKDSIPRDPTKRQYRRKVDDNKASVTKSPKPSTNSKMSSQFDPLVKILFEQKFKLKRNSSSAKASKSDTQPTQQVVSAEGGGQVVGKDRMHEILNILAIFGEHFETDLTVAHGAVDTPSETFTVTTQSPAVDVQDMSCIHVEGYEAHRWIRIVNFCARGWSNKTVLYLCKDALVNDYVMTDTPVQDSQGTVYANRFCAFCNHVHVSKMRKWHSAWTCERNDNPAASLMQAGPFGDLLAVVTSLRFGNTCKMIRTPAIPDTIRWCQTPLLRGSHDMPLVNVEEHVPLGSGYPVSLNILMNFDFSGKTHIMFEDLYAEESIETKLCPQGNFVWDGELGRCREVLCAKGFHFDDSYTTCLEDDSSVTIDEEEVITDLSQLAQSNDIERVTLEVEVPSGFAALITITSNEFWKQQIAKQLNITITRIQEFNITVENATGGASTLLIQKLSTGDLPSRREGEAGPDSYSDHGAAFTKDLPVLTSERSKLVEEADHDSDRSTESSQSESFPETLDDKSTLDETLGGNEKSKAGTSKNDLGDEGGRLNSEARPQAPEYSTVLNGEMNEEVPEKVPDMPQPVALLLLSPDTTKTEEEEEAPASSALDPLSDLTLEEDYDTHNEFKVIMSFILLPPESFRSGEKRSGNVVEALSSLVSSKEFKFFINGTSLQVANMAQEDKVGVFSPACPHGVLLVLDGQQIQLMSTGEDSPLDVNITTLKDLRTGKCYVQGMFDVSFIVTQPIGNTTEKAHSYVYNALACEMPRITDSHCRRIRIKAEEYTIQPITKALTFQNTTFNISSYEFLDDKYNEVEICVPEFYKEAMALRPSRVEHYYYYTKNCATDYQDWLKAEGYLTAVLGRISIVALFAVLLTYLLFPKLRNLPGVNTMNLTFALFLAEVIFVSGEEVQIPWLCTAVAASLHYCFLSSHCWMNVMSYDVYRTFAASTCILTRVRDKRKMFPRYALYAWGMPLLVLGACLFIDLSHVFPAISIGYGGTWSSGFNDTGFGNWSSEENHHDTVTMTTNGDSLGEASGEAGEEEEVKRANSSESGGFSVAAGHSFSCWIQEPLAALFVFGAPILMIFLINCVLFVRTIVSIRRTTRLARHSGVNRTHSSNSARQMSGHNDVILYVKMSSVMGFTWVFGLASSVISSVTQEPSDVICYVLHILGVLFPILNSSQGLFIFFAFVFNRRVLGLYRVLIRQVKDYTLSKKKSLYTSAGKKAKTNIATIAKA